MPWSRVINSTEESLDLNISTKKNVQNAIANGLVIAWMGKVKATEEVWWMWDIFKQKSLNLTEIEKTKSNMAAYTVLLIVKAIEKESSVTTH